MDYKQRIKKLLSVICVIVNRQHAESTLLGTFLHKDLSSTDKTKEPIDSSKAAQS